MIASRLLPIAALLLLPAAALAQDEAARPLNPMAGLDKGSLKAFVELPLFETSRHKPFVAPPLVYVPPPPQPVVVSPPSLRLLGVVEGAHSLVAIVHRDDTGKTETLHSGDLVGGWRVEVRPVGLRVASGDRAYEYAMFRGGAQQGPMPVALPPPTVAARDAGTGEPR